MRKHVAVFFFLLTVLFASQIQLSIGLQKPYDWKIPADSGYNTYLISLTTADSWQVDTTVDITFRLTLTSKRPVLDHAETNKVKIILNSENFYMDSGDQTEAKILRNIGDYWEKKVTFYIPAEKVIRGQTVSVSVVLVVSINEIDNIQWRSWGHTAQTYDDPMFVNLSRPILSTLELIVIVVVIIAVAVVIGISSFILYRRKRKTAKPQSLQTQ